MNNQIISERITSTVSKLDTQKSARIYQLILLLVVTGFAAGLRLYRLGQWSFWIDEVITLNVVRDTFSNGLISAYASGKELSLLLIGSTVNLLGTNEFSARLVPAILGIALVPLVYFCIRRLYDPVVAIAAAILLAFSPWHIFWSQNARYVSALILFYTLSIMFFALAMQTDKKRYFVASTIFFALAVLERLYGIFLIPTVIGYLFAIWLFRIEKPEGFKWSRLIPYLLALGLIAAILLAPVQQEPDTWSDSFFTIEGPGPLGILFSFLDWMTVPIVGLNLIAVPYLIFTNRNHKTLLFIFGGFVPLLGVMTASLIQFADVRYTIVAMPSMLILTAVILSEIYQGLKNSNKHFYAFALLLLLILEPMLVNWFYYSPENTLWTDWRGGFQYVQEHQQDGDIVFSSKPLMGEYYLAQPMPLVDGTDPRVGPNGNEATDQDVYFVVKRDQPADGRYYDPDFKAWVTNNTNLVFQTINVDVYLYSPIDE